VKRSLSSFSRHLMDDSSLVSAGGQLNPSGDFLFCVLLPV
jgi:hypothetical protein